jgi:hypothetical protein
MNLRLGLLLLPFFLASCGTPEKSSHLLEFRDVKRADRRSDGLYNVVCMDGSIEIGVTLEQITGDKVCNKSPASTPIFSSSSSTGFDVYDSTGRRIGRFLEESQGQDLRILISDGHIVNINSLEGTFRNITGQEFWNCMYETADCTGTCYAPLPSTLPSDTVNWAFSADGPWIREKRDSVTVSGRNIKSAYDTGSCVAKEFTYSSTLFGFKKWENPFGQYPLPAPMTIR